MTERAILALADAIFALADALSQEKPKRKRTETGRRPPPMDLTKEEKLALKTWAEQKEPWAIPHLRRLVDDMLTYHRSEGKLKVDWVLTAQRWITNARTKYGEDKAPTAKKGNGRGDVLDAAREIAATFGLGRALADDDQAVFDVPAEQSRKH